MSKKSKSQLNEVEVKNPHGINRANMDLTVKAGDDFFRYAGGGWMDAHSLSERPDLMSYSITTMLHERNQERLREMFEELCKSEHEAGTEEQKIADLYRLGLDIERMNREGAQPLAADIKQIKAFKKANMTRFMAELHRDVAMPFFGVGIGVDIKDSTRRVVRVGAGNLCLPSRDYYLDTDDKSKEIQQAYRDYMVKLFTVVGYSERVAKRMCKIIYDVEYKYAEACLELAELRNPENLYNVCTIDQLQQDYPFINWREYLDVLGMKNVTTVILTQPKVMAVNNELMAELTELQMRDYMVGQFIKRAAPLLGDEISDVDFDFYARRLGGQQERKPRWKIALNMANSIMSDAVGQVYVKKYLPKESKAKVLKLIHTLRMSLAEHIAQLDWMDKQTKINALLKLNALAVKVGYPDKWDVDDFVVDPAKNLYENLKEIGNYFFNKNVKKLDDPVDRDEWGMSPQTINAYYSPVFNEICFPAAFLQAPYFDPEADDAVNYGSLGAVIGHEMTHGYDDQGRKFDADGNLNGWWTEDDLAKFNAATQKLVEQFDQIVVIGDLHINGRLTLGENIADQAGLRIALDAFFKTAQYKEGKEIDGFTPLQRFFLSYGLGWAENANDEVTILQTKNGVHPMNRYRVNQTLRNIDEFHEAFDVKPGDAMWLAPENRVVVW